MRVAILNQNRVVAFMDNDAEDALHFYNDTIHNYLKGTASTFSFTCTMRHKDSNYITAGTNLAFVYKNRHYWFTVVTITQDEYELKVVAYSGTLQLNYQTITYSMTRETRPTLQQMLRGIKLNSGTELMFEVGSVEGSISTETRENKWSSISTEATNVLARLFDVATEYGAELELETRLNDDYTLEGIYVNAYKAHDNENQGLGTDRTDIYLRYGYNIDSITRELDLTDFFTAIEPYFADGGVFTLREGYTEYGEDGTLMYQVKPFVHADWSTYRIYAVNSREQFPALTGDGYITKKWETEYTDANTLFAQALSYLKRRSVPDATYEIKGYIDAGIGDTFTVIDEDLNLYLKARVVEQEICTTDEQSCKTTFSTLNELKVGSYGGGDVSYSVTASYDGYETIGGKTYVRMKADVKIGSYSLSESSIANRGMKVNWYFNGELIGSGLRISVPRSDYYEKGMNAYGVQIRLEGE